MISNLSIYISNILLKTKSIKISSVFWVKRTSAGGTHTDSVLKYFCYLVSFPIALCPEYSLNLFKFLSHIILSVLLLIICNYVFQYNLHILILKNKKQIYYNKPMQFFIYLSIVVLICNLCFFNYSHLLLYIYLLMLFKQLGKITKNIRAHKRKRWKRLKN